MSQINHQPTDLECKIAVIMCHYTYYYVNWHEAGSRNFILKNKKNIEKRVSGRIKEVINVCLSEKTEKEQEQERLNKENNKTNSVIEKIKKEEEKLNKENEKIKRPLDLYDLYKECGYCGDKDSYLCKFEFEEVNQELKKWHVVYYDKNYKNESNKQIIVSDKGGNRIIYKANGIYYNNFIKAEEYSGFGSVLFIKEEGGTQEYIYSTNGTDFDSLFRDWIFANILQGLTGISAQHTTSVNYAKKLDEMLEGRKLLFIGHSLGGGLASNNAIVTKDRFAVTFNAAGLNVLRVKASELFSKNRSSVFHPSKSWNRVHPIRLKQDALDQLQHYILKSLTHSLLERGFGRKPLVIEPSGLGIWGGHGLNLFLQEHILRKVVFTKKVQDENDSGRLFDWSEENVKADEMKVKGSIGEFVFDGKGYSFSDLAKENGGK